MENEIWLSELLLPSPNPVDTVWLGQQMQGLRAGSHPPPSPRRGSCVRPASTAARVCTAVNRRRLSEQPLVRCGHSLCPNIQGVLVRDQRSLGFGQARVRRPLCTQDFPLLREECLAPLVRGHLIPPLSSVPENSLYSTRRYSPYPLPLKSHCPFWKELSLNNKGLFLSLTLEWEPGEAH